VPDTGTERPPAEIPIGKAEVIHHVDGPAVILSYGHIFPNVLQATEILEEDDIAVGIVNARFAKPVDVDMLHDIATRYPVIVSVEDGAASCGFGSAVNEAFVAMGIEARCEIIGVPDVFIEHGDQAFQHELAGISPGKIALRVRAAISAYEARLAHGSRRDNHFA
jgi:1-deoxy-D-xylulose-5-phosphate synthase